MYLTNLLWPNGQTTCHNPNAVHYTSMHLSACIGTPINGNQHMFRVREGLPSMAPNKFEIIWTSLLLLAVLPGLPPLLDRVPTTKVAMLALLAVEAPLISPEPSARSALACSVEARAL